jgi:hypothetical protein
MSVAEALITIAVPRPGQRAVVHLSQARSETPNFGRNSSLIRGDASGARYYRKSPPSRLGPCRQRELEEGRFECRIAGRLVCHWRQ